MQTYPFLYPNNLQATLASVAPNPLTHTAPHFPCILTSSKPLYRVLSRILRPEVGNHISRIAVVY